jgi:SAM-dependent methyltransferase
MSILIVVLVIVVLTFGLVVFRGAPYVPSHRSEVTRAFRELYPISSKDVLLDVGSGDGVILREAAKRGARAIGYEINPILVMISRLLAKGNKQISTTFADFWLKDFPNDTTIVYAFAVSRDIEKLRRKMQNEADRLRRPLHLMVYGASLVEYPVTKKLRGHHLYLFVPLQEGKA